MQQARSNLLSSRRGKNGTGNACIESASPNGGRPSRLMTGATAGEDTDVPTICE